MGYLSKKIALGFAVLGFAFLAQSAVADDEVSLEQTYDDLQQMQSKLNDSQDADLKALAPTLDRALDAIAGFADRDRDRDRDHRGGGMHRPHPHPGPRPGPHPGPGPRPRFERFYCIAVDRGFEEHRGGHYGDGHDERWAEREAMRECMRYHGSCRIRRCDRK
jgi:hypothetical protein